MKVKFRYAVMLGLILGVVTAAVYYMSRPLRVIDETPQAIEDGLREIYIVSRDIITHNEKTVTEVRIIRETIGKNVAALTPSMPSAKPNSQPRK